MADFVRVWDSTDKQYELYDVSKTYGTFTGLTGGDMKLSMTSYNVMNHNGEVTTRLIPGQISYSEINLSCAMSDIVPELTDWFLQAKSGNMKGLRRNCSIAHLKQTDGGKIEAAVTWELINALPVSLPGFSFSAYLGTSSTTFKLKLQVEEILITYP